MLEEFFGQRVDGIGPFPKGWDNNLHDIQPEVHVFAETLLGDVLEEIAVGRSEDANVHTPRSRLADTADLPVLEHAQQLRLGHEGHVADFV